MRYLQITFTKDLNFFIRSKPEKQIITYPLNRKASIKNIVESMGVPHTEIGAIVIDGDEVDFNFIPVHSRTAHIFGITKPFDVTIPSLLRPHPLKEIRFIADVNVGKLAKLLRMSGIDTAYATSFSDKTIAAIAEKDGRVVLSKDIGLLKYRKITFGKYIKSIYPEDQLAETISFFRLKNRYRPFSLCLRCNISLQVIKKEDILSQLEPKTRKYYNKFNICPNCKKIYWQGTHHEDMKKRLVKWEIALF